MLPFIDTNSVHISIPDSPSTYVVGVLGYGKSCGKSTLAASLSSSIPSESLAILTGNVGYDGLVFQKFLTGVSSTVNDVTVITSVDTIATYDVVILDDWDQLVVSPHLITYIVPANIYADLSLGLKDTAYDDYISRLCEALAVKYPDVPVKLVDERLIQKSTSFHLLDETDRLIIRELERGLLNNVPLKELREMLRNSDMGSWRSGDKI